MPILSISSLSTLVLVTAFTLVNTHVPDPYLDEIFHIPQAQRYCRHDYTWDQSITTPPGLYILSALPLRSLGISCSPLLLRGTNLLLLLLIRWPIAHLLSLSSPSKPTPTSYSQHVLRRRYSWEEASVIASFPLLFFFASLYYTDVFSTLCVVGCYALGRSGKPWLAGVAGLASLTARQTNVVWIGFILALSLRVEGTYDPLISSGPRSIPRSIASAVRAVLRRPVKATTSIAPYLPSLVAFAAFLVWNGGIVLGHKEQHQPVPHFPQILYFIAFISVLLLPTLLAEGLLRTIRGALHVGLGGITNVALSAVALGGMVFVIHKFTIFHPFLLADNRHYVFYVLRRVLIPYPWAKYALAPAYLVAGWAWLWRLRNSVTTLWLLAFIACTAAVLVPTPLIEPRYFLIPTLLVRLELGTSATLSAVSMSDKSGQSVQPSHSKKYGQSSRVKSGEADRIERRKEADRGDGKGSEVVPLWIEFAWYSAINIATTALFLLVKFRWPGWEGWMRFMW